MRGERQGLNGLPSSLHLKLSGRLARGRVRAAEGDGGLALPDLDLEDRRLRRGGIDGIGMEAPVGAEGDHGSPAAHSVKSG